MWIGWQASSLGQGVFLLLATTQIYKHDDYEPRCPFHGAHQGVLVDLLHKRGQLPLIRIHCLKNFHSELYSAHHSWKPIKHVTDHHCIEIIT